MGRKGTKKKPLKVERTGAVEVTYYVMPNLELTALMAKVLNKTISKLITRDKCDFFTELCELKAEVREFNEFTVTGHIYLTRSIHYTVKLAPTEVLIKFPEGLIKTKSYKNLNKELLDLAEWVVYSTVGDEYREEEFNTEMYEDRDKGDYNPDLYENTPDY